MERNLKLKVFLHPSTLRRLRGPDSKLVERMERNYDLQIEFEASDSYHLENFKIIDLANDQEVR